MMRYPIRRDRPGALAMMAHPEGGHRLAESAAELRAGGVDVLISLLTEPESAGLGLAGMQQAAAEAGMGYRAFPIRDHGTPTDTWAFGQLVGELTAELAAGRSVTVHCHAGIGRSSLLAAGILVREGTGVAAAWQRIGFARGWTVPEHPDQGRWLARWAAADRRINRPVAAV